MKQHILKIRAVDKDFFIFLRDGIKTIETRTATPKYQKIKEGDFLIFVCGNKKLKKKVKKVHLLGSVDKLLERFDFKKIMPHTSSKKEAKKIWHSFPGYKEKISKYGLIVLVLE